MEKILIKGIGEAVYYDECDNGLKIYVWENHRVNSFMGSLTVLVGSEDVEYEINHQKKKVPYGTAHYLEHILCKNNDGTSLLKDFRKIGSYSNASTYGYRTSFEFIGTNNIKENIDLLLDSLYNKRFYNKPFEDERGPILEEARMYLDNPNRVLNLKVNESLFHSYPNRTSGVGTIDDINNISVKDVKKLYKDFYHPENSFIVITGNVNAEEVIKFIKDNQKNKVFDVYKKPHNKDYNEPDEIVSTYMSVKTNVELPEIILSLKIPKKKFADLQVYEVYCILGATLSSNFGATSKFRDELVNKKLMTSLFSQYYIERDYWLIQLICKTKYPEEMIKILTNKLNNLEFDEADINRKKKSKIANVIMSYEDIENVNNYLSYSISKLGYFCVNEKEILDNLNIAKIKSVFSMIDFNNTSTVLALPKKGKH